MEVFAHRLQLFFAGILIVCGLVLLPILLVGATNIIQNEPWRGSGVGNNAGALSSGTSNVVEDNIKTVAHGFTDIVSDTTSVVMGGVKTVGHGIASGVGFVVGIPGNIIGFFSDEPSVNAFIQPDSDEEIPVIKTYANPILPSYANGVQLLTASANTTPVDTKQDASWPIHGRITTFFGVPHWPYQETHTGMDIASGKPSGVTPVLPYKPGKVIETIYSARGLGNHVVVDHGNNITSVYGHMSSITVQNGQIVGANTPLGYEGSTGVSTGTHLHFEIRVNGVFVNPQDYITGRP